MGLALWESFLRTHLAPYSAPLVLLLVLQLVGTLASLYLPSLNGRIIDEGVATGDTGFIVRAGVAMLAVSLVQVLATIGATRRRPHRGLAGAGRPAGRLPPRRRVLGAGGLALRRTHPDQPQHQ